LATSSGIYDLLRQDIVSGKYEPMHFFDPRQVATDHCTSVAPVREALIRLSERRLVRWEKNRGFFVEKLSCQAALFNLNQLAAAYCYAIKRAEECQLAPHIARGVDVKREISSPAEYLAWQGAIASQLFSEGENEFVCALWDRIWIYRNSYLADGPTMEYLNRTLSELTKRFAQREFDTCSGLAGNVFAHVMERIPNLLSKVNA
jgi:DNA-binding GntR family transcriptional regulator